MFPQSLKNHLEGILDTEIINIQTVGGGSINQAANISVGRGQDFFLKWNNTAASDMFPKEKRGLELLRSAKTGLHIPEVFDIGQCKGTGYILMEYIEEKSAGRKSAEQFGRVLAQLHQTTADRFGLEYDNYIGRLVQPNDQAENWIDFFIEQRLDIQLQQATEAGKLQSQTVDQFHKLYKKLSDILPEEPPSLLHGDLWGGNYFFDSKGNTAIFDPAVYYGNREIELAFTHLFGGFPAKFYDAYETAFPMEPNFNERKDIYNLYPLLVHTNMFGGHYAWQVASIVQQFV